MGKSARRDLPSGVVEFGQVHIGSKGSADYNGDHINLPQCSVKVRVVFSQASGELKWSGEHRNHSAKKMRKEPPTNCVKVRAEGV